MDVSELLVYTIVVKTVATLADFLLVLSDFFYLADYISIYQIAFD